MDPNANLAEQLRIAERILGGELGDNPDVMRLALLVESLDEWIHHAHGFLPARWTPGSRAKQT